MTVSPLLDVKTANEISQTFVEQGITTSSTDSSDSGGLKADNYPAWKMDRDLGLVYRLLDSTSANGGLSEEAKKEVSSLL